MTLNTPRNDDLLIDMLGECDDGTFVNSIMLLISADEPSSRIDDRSIIKHNRSIIHIDRSITAPSLRTIPPISISVSDSKFIDPIMTCVMDVMMEPPT